MVLTKLSEWLTENPVGPYEVCLFTVKPGEDPGEYTAGRVVFRAEKAKLQNGVVTFNGPNGEVVLVEAALDGPEIGVLETGQSFWRAGYVNLEVTVEGFYPNVVVVVTKI
ncbi:MAG: hypothetical protein QHH75_10690 [Bacillota bacterium]|nr:hypothetical protein [Bacillota bacterium]